MNFKNKMPIMMLLCFIFIIIFNCSSPPDTSKSTKQSTTTQTFINNEPDGFRDLKWGDSPSKLKGKDLPTFYGSEILEWSKFLGEYREALNSTVKSGILSSIDNYPVLNNIVKLHKKRDDNNLAGLKISNQSVSEFPIDVYYYFYKKKFFCSSVKISYEDIKSRDDINKLTNVISEKYGKHTDEYITSNEDKESSFVKKYQLDYPLYNRETKEPIPTYIWEGNKSLIIQRYNEAIWINKDIHDEIIRDAKEKIGIITKKDAEGREKGKGKGF